MIPGNNRRHILTKTSRKLTECHLDIKLTINNFFFYQLPDSRHRVLEAVLKTVDAPSINFLVTRGRKRFSVPLSWSAVAGRWKFLSRTPPSTFFIELRGNIKGKCTI